MDKSLQSVDCDALFSDYNVNEKWAIFKELLDNAVSTRVPKRKRRTRQKMVDMRPGRKSKKIWNNYRDTKNSYTFNSYEMDLDNATNAMRSAMTSRIRKPSTANQGNR